MRNFGRCLYVIRIQKTFMLKFPSKENLESAKLVTGLVQTAIIVTGVSLAFLYCIGERITPTGLSLGDVLFIILIAFGFGVLMVLGSVYGAMAALFPMQCLVWLAKRRTSQPEKRIDIVPSLQGKGNSITSILLLTLFGLLIVSTLDKGSPDFNVTRICAFFLVFGFWLLLVFGLRWPAERALAPALRVLILTGVMVATITTTSPSLLNFTMMIIGVRSEPSVLICTES